MRSASSYDYAPPLPSRKGTWYCIHCKSSLAQEYSTESRRHAHGFLDVSSRPARIFLGTKTKDTPGICGRMLRVETRPSMYEARHMYFFPWLCDRVRVSVEVPWRQTANHAPMLTVECVRKPEGARIVHQIEEQGGPVSGDKSDDSAVRPSLPNPDYPFAPSQKLASAPKWHSWRSSPSNGFPHSFRRLTVPFLIADQSRRNQNRCFDRSGDARRARDAKWGVVAICARTKLQGVLKHLPHDWIKIEAPNHPPGTSVGWLLAPVVRGVYGSCATVAFQLLRSSN